VCANSASTGLCGGQRVTAVPTATDSSNAIHGPDGKIVHIMGRSTGGSEAVNRRAALALMRQPAISATRQVAVARGPTESILATHHFTFVLHTSPFTLYPLPFVCRSIREDIHTCCVTSFGAQF
jgi:hypothetical protein